MKFLLDEDVAVEIVRCLQHQGHETQLVFEALGPRTQDDRVWEHAVGTDAILVTCYRDDFLKLAGTAPETGLIIVNRRRTRQAECRRVLELLRNAGEAGLRKNINFARCHFRIAKRKDFNSPIQLVTPFPAINTSLRLTQSGE